VFSTVDYFILESNGLGNVSGIGLAVDLIPNSSAFAVTWSDLVFPDDFTLDSLPTANYVGVTSLGRCSWSFSNQNLQRIPQSNDGVAGFFVFESKKLLQSLPLNGSFTDWLSNNQESFEFRALALGETREYGTVEAVVSTKIGKRSRPYNSLEFGQTEVLKTASTPEGVMLLEREALWYKEATRLGFSRMPKIHSFDPLKMEFLNGPTIAEGDWPLEAKQNILLDIIATLENMHSLSSGPVDVPAQYGVYYLKTLRRLDQVRRAIPLSDYDNISINGVMCRNVLIQSGFLERAVLNSFIDSKFGFIHGDCTFSNIILSEDRFVRFIDPRGYFGKDCFLGDIHYDWAKLYFSVVGGFDRFNVGDFRLEIQDAEALVFVPPSGWESLAGILLERAGVSESKVRLIHSIIWLSLASHCYEDFDSMAAAFYIGTFEFERWYQDFGCYENLNVRFPQ